MRKLKAIKSPLSLLISALLIVGLSFNSDATLAQVDYSKGTVPPPLNQDLIRRVIPKVPAPSRPAVNMFWEGTVPPPLTPIDYEYLSQFLDDAKKILLNAFARAQGAGANDRIEIYTRAIRDVVRKINRERDGYNHMMYIVLNQALHLVVERPDTTPDVAGPAALAGTSNKGLKAQILKAHMQLAIKYFVDNVSVQLEPSRVLLPYAQLGWDRILLMYNFWPGIMDSAVALNFVKASIGHWLAIARSLEIDDANEAPQIFAMYSIYDRLVAMESQMISMSSEEFDKELRTVRGDMEIIIRDINELVNGNRLQKIRERVEQQMKSRPSPTGHSSPEAVPYSGHSGQKPIPYEGGN